MVFKYFLSPYCIIQNKIKIKKKGFVCLKIDFRNLLSKYTCI